VKYTNVKKSDLLQIVGNTSLRGGGLPINDGFELSKFGGFIITEREKVAITSLGKEITSLWDKEEPNSLVIRKLLLPLVIKIMPPWVAFSSKPLKERICAIPERWKEVLRDAELLENPLFDDANKWWATLQHIIMEKDEQRKKVIGEAGENLTMNFERNRLLTENQSSLADKIKWISKESNEYGFDISSFFGLLKLSHQKPETLMMIEVKSTTSSSDKNFRFFLTRNEWETAEKNIQNYYFYFWRHIKITGGNIHANGPIILPAYMVKHYVPVDNKKNGKWTECRIDFDIKEIVNYSI